MFVNLRKLKTAIVKTKGGVHTPWKATGGHNWHDGGGQKTHSSESSSCRGKARGKSWMKYCWGEFEKERIDAKIWVCLNTEETRDFISQMGMNSNMLVCACSRLSQRIPMPLICSGVLNIFHPNSGAVPLVSSMSK